MIDSSALISGDWQPTTVHSFLAVAFVTPALFIAGLSLIAIPIIIHILNRRRFKTIQWAAMEFLLRAMRKNRKRIRFEQLILLATRCLVLVFLGMALARPVACNQSTLASLAGNRSGLHVVIIDNSLSMSYALDRAEARTHLDQAKKIAKLQIARLNAGGESVALITAGAPAKAVLVKPTYDLEAARSAIDRIEQAYGATDLLGAFNLAAEIAREDRQPTRHLYIFSDATRSAWEASDAGAIKQALVDLAGVYRLTHLSMSRGVQWNQAATSLEPVSRLVTRLSHDFTSTLRGFGRGPDPIVQWKLDDATLPGANTLRLDLDTPPVTQTQINFGAGGPHTVSVSVASDDRLPLDNTRWRAVDVAAELKVLIVEGERGTSVLGGSAAFLSLALAPPREAGGPGTPARSSSYILPEVISDLELGNRVLSDYRCLILVGVSQLQSSLADAVQKFVQAGGTLVLFMGEPVNADNYNSVLLPRGLVPGRLTRRMSVASDQAGFTFDFKPENVHPYLQAFRNQEKSGLDTAQIFTYWQVELNPEAGAERVLNYKPQPGISTGIGEAMREPDAAITTHSLDAGRVVFITTSAGPEWTTLPAKPAYLTLVHELISNSVDSGDAWLNRVVGQSIEIPSTIKLTSTPTLFDPAQQPIALEPTSSDAGADYRSPPLLKPGVYTIATGARRYPVVVNVPAEESDIRTLDNPALKAAMGDADVELLSDDLPELAQRQDDRLDFGWSVMAIVLALGAVECVMAMRFGHHRK